MAVATPTTPTCNNTSAGVILLSDDGQSLFLQRRKKFPWGWACPAGHVDEGEPFIRAAIRELKEETNLDAGDNIHLVLEADCNNACRRPGGSWHHWRVYQTSATGQVIENEDEAEGAGWYPLSQVQALAARTEAYRAGRITDEEWRADPGLEGVWYNFLKALKIIQVPAANSYIFVPSSGTFIVKINGKQASNWRDLETEARAAIEPMIRQRWQQHWQNVIKGAHKALQAESLDGLMDVLVGLSPSMEYHCPPELAAKAKVE